LVGKPEGKSHFEDLGINRRIILKSSTSRSGLFDPFHSFRR
jgi:hypothetical protein